MFKPVYLFAAQKRAVGQIAGFFVSLLVTIASIGLFPVKSFAQLVNQEFSNGVVGSSVTAAPVSWLTNGTGNGTFVIANASPILSLCYNGGSGNYLAVTKATSGTSNVGVNFNQTVAASSTFYYSFLLTVSSASATSDYFAALATTVSSPTYFARLFCQTTSGGYKLGVAAASTTASYKTSPTVLSFGTTYLVVVRYDYVSGSNNDVVSLWINPALSAEPSLAGAEISQTASLNSEAPALANNGAFTLRNNSSTPNYSIDGIRVAYGTASTAAWTSLNATLSPTAPVATAVSNAGCSQFTAIWSAVSSATSYALDVSTSNLFTSFVSGYSGLDVGNNTAYAVTGLDPGTAYYYRVRALSGSCSSANSATVSGTTLKAPEITGQPTAPAATCSGTGLQTLTVNTVGSDLVYAWRKNGVPVSNGTVISGQGTNTLTLTNPTTADAGSYDVLVTGACSPAAVSTVVAVTVRSLPAATVSGDAAVCLNGTSPTITFTGTNGVAPYTFTYTLNNGAPLTVQSTGGGIATVTVPTTAAGTFLYTLVGVEDAAPGACSSAATGSATVTVSGPLTPTVSAGGVTTFCSGESVTLTSSATTGNQWYRNGSLLAGETNQSLVATASGSYTVVVTENGCNSLPSQATAVNVNPLPVLTGATQQATTCAGLGAVISLTGLLPNSTSTVGYTINGVPQVPVAGVAADNAGSASFVTGPLSGAANGQVLQVTSLTTTGSSPACSASFSQSLVLAVSATAPATIAYSGSPYCASGTAAVTRTGQTGGTFSSTSGLVIDPVTGTVDLANSTPGTYTVTYSLGSGDCNSTAVLVINPNPSLSSSVTPVTCNGLANGAVSLTVNNATAAAYIWTGPGGFVANTKDVSGLVAGTYSVHVTSTQGCMTVLPVTVPEPAVLAGSLLSKIDNACNGGSSGQITASATGGTLPFAFTLAGPTVNSSGASSGIFSGLSAGTYTVNINDANGCAASVSNIVVTQPTGTAPDATLAASDYSDNFFASVGNEITVVFQVNEVGGNPAANAMLRLTKQAGYTFSLPAVSTVTIGSGANATMYTVDNSRWTANSSDPVFYSVALNSGQQLACGQAVFLAVKLTRTTPSKSVFAITAQVRNVTGEAQTGNNAAAILLVAQ